MGKTFNTGYLQNIIQYDGSNNIILPSLIGTGTRIVVAAANGTLSSQTASTTNIAEGTNLYYTDTRVGTYLSANTYATQSYVTTAIANLVDASPVTLDTLNELAAALGDDPNFATTVATSIGTKQAQLNGTGFVKVSGTTVSYDNSTYLTTSSASSTYVPYTGASADLVLGANNFSSKRVSVLKSSDGYGGFTSNYLFLQTGSSTTSVGTDGISLFSKPNQRALSINYDIGGTNYAATLDANLLNASRTFEFPNASGVLALTSNIPTNNNQLTNGAGYITSSALSPYLPLAGGTLTGSLAGTTSIFSSDFTQNETSKVGISFASGYGQINAWGANTSTYGGLKFQISVSNGNTVNALTLLPSGAATFISSVRAKGMSVDGTGGSGFLAQLDGNNSAANGAYLGFVNAANTRYFISQLDTSNDINYYYFNGSSWSSSLIKFSNIGAATFSSSVTATTLTLSTTTADYTATITNVQDSSQGLLVRATDNDTNLYLLNLQSSNGATSQTWVDRFAVTKGGNVGIGTPSPNTKLEIKGSIRLDSRSKVDTGEIDSITFTKDRPDASTGTYEMGAIRSFTYGGYAGGLTFYSGRHTGGGNYGLVSVMTIGSTTDIGLANVGIGTTSPNTLLHVYGSGTVSKFESSTTNSAININHNANGGIIGYSNQGSTGNLFYITTGSGVIGGGISMDNNGNVGIGALNPRTRLEVRATSNAEVPVLGTATGVAAFTSANGNYGLQLNSTSDGSFHIQSQRFDAIATAYSIILNYAGGNVGIGTAPSYKLHVNGTNGSIAISGGGYTLNPIPMLIGQYTSTRGYIQVPDQGSIEMWNGGSSIIAEFKNNSNSIFYGSVGIGTATPLGTLSTIGGAVQIMGDYRNHQTIIKSAGTSGTLSGSLLITIPQMSNGNVDGYGGYSCEVYVAGYPGLFCHAWFSGYVNGGLTNSEATILRSSGGWSISQTSYGANNQGFQFTIDYPSYIVHPTARIIFNKGGSPNSTEYPANQITAVFS